MRVTVDRLRGSTPSCSYNCRSTAARISDRLRSTALRTRSSNEAGAASIDALAFDDRVHRAFRQCLHRPGMRLRPLPAHAHMQERIAEKVELDDRKCLVGVK